MEDSSSLGSTWRPSSTTSSLSEKLDEVVLPLVGRKDHTEKLLSAIFGSHESPHHPRVISVTGESGVGKTKLVRDFYEKHQTKCQFDAQAWVSFGPNLSASDILKLIIHRLTDGETCPKQKLKRKLGELLDEKHVYLLVIDGEVNSSEWNRIFTFLPKCSNPSSRVVRISQTEPEQPPDIYGKQIKIEVKHFEIKETTELFRQTFFLKDQGAQYIANGTTDPIDKYKQEIFDNTKGFPLAVVLLSGLLRTKEYPEEWDSVFKHLKSMQSKRLDKILSICFDDLHYDIKSCFLYFAALPVNTLIRAHNLVCMWMAEGFLIPKEGRTMEKVGEQYLKELIDRRLVNLAPIDYAVPGDERVAVQSKVHAFLQLEAKEGGFVEIHGGDDIPTMSTARRLSLQNHRDKYAAFAYPLPKLRTILSNFEKQDDEEEEATEVNKEADDAASKEDGDVGCSSFSRRGANSKDKIKMFVRQLLRNSRFLRVIHFNGLEIDKKLPSEIGNVVHLQYLRVTSCSLEEIPPSIGRLCNLQTLDVRDTNVKRLPDAFWRIRTLRHVLGYHLMLPKRVGHLMQLRTLNTVKPDDTEGWGSKTFSKMTRLWSLHIREVKVQGENHIKNKTALLKALTLLKYLVVLTIKADTIPSEVFTSSNLPRLKAMELKGKLSDFLEVEIRSHLPNLVKLSLQDTEVSQIFIDMLGKLQFLTTLNLQPGSYKEQQLVFTDGFRSLKELMVHLDLKRIEMRKSALPVLEELDIFSDCSNDLELVIYDHPLVVEKIKRDNKKLYKKITHAVDVQVQGESHNKEAATNV